MNITFSMWLANVLAVACINPSEKEEGSIRAGRTLCKKSMYFLPGLCPRCLIFGTCFDMQTNS